MPHDGGVADLISLTAPDVRQLLLLLPAASP
jgi:hypothetical protein